ncbi:MAG TPA: nitrile hydratase subunit beta [Steroidobacteraceae bacterium]|jgi:nitrile hydratase|nr:nitrile hydratase subunit beta [Steroidobacteraceae bacterium]
MNGIHDMGGMQDMGAIAYAKSEPVFHEAWEGRLYSMSYAVQGTGKLRLGLRPPMEAIPPGEYLRMSYYERWLTSITERMIASDMVTRAEIESGRPETGSVKATLALSPAQAVAALFKIPATRRDLSVPARFQVGQSVRARNINPITHTRSPRYARGKTGSIERDHGVFVFSDTSAYSQGENPQHLYSVRFSARELWGEQGAPHDAVYLDMFDDYLEPV